MTTQPLPIILYVLLSGMLLSCQGEPAEQETATDNVPRGAEMEQIVARQDTAAVNPDNSSFVFYEQDKLESYLPRERIVFMLWDTLNDQPSQLPSEKEEGKSVVRKASDRAPLFSRACLTQEGRAQAVCSYQAVQDYLQENIAYPAPAVTSDERFVVYLSVVINAQGEVQGPVRLMDMEGERCLPCIEEARRLLRDMPDWLPARYQDQPVATRISIPVYFRQVPDGTS